MSGSRGITKLQSESGLRKAIKDAIQEGFEKKALVEEYVAGQEYSVESISWEGKHTFLAITKKFTTGSPHFIETGHEQPVQLKKKKIDQVKNIVFHALDTLQIKYGASHSELKISNDGRISLIEIGARMGGDCIGSSLVEISTGVEFVADVIKIALGEKPEIHFANKPKAAAIRYILSQEDMKVYKQVKQEHPEYIVEENIEKDVSGEVKDSSGRYGYFILSADDVGCLDSYMPVEVEDKDKGTSCGKSKAYR